MVEIEVLPPGLRGAGSVPFISTPPDCSSFSIRAAASSGELACPMWVTLVGSPIEVICTGRKVHTEIGG